MGPGKHRYSVRPASPDDLDRILQILTEGWKRVYARTLTPADWENFEKERLRETYASYFEPDSPRSLIVVQDAENEIYGFALYGASKNFGDVQQIYATYVDARHERKSIGLMLMSAMAREISGPVMLKVCENNLKALDYYRGLGGDVTHQTSRQFLGKTISDHVVVWRDARGLAQAIANKRYWHLNDHHGGAGTPGPAEHPSP